jgi:hypothetical protein
MVLATDITRITSAGTAKTANNPGVLRSCAIAVTTIASEQMRTSHNSRRVGERRYPCSSVVSTMIISPIVLALSAAAVENHSAARMRRAES